MKKLHNILQSFLSYWFPIDAAQTFLKYYKKPQLIASAMPQSWL